MKMKSRDRPRNNI